MLAIACCLQSAAGVFDTLQKVAKADRIKYAEDIYTKKLRTADSAYAIAQINELITLSNKINDHSLECAGWSLLADHYARIRGSNATSDSLHAKAIDLSKKYHLPLMEGICNYKMGRYFYSFKRYPPAFEYLLKANDIFDDIGYTNVPLASNFLYYLGSIYYETGDLDRAANFYQQSLNLPTTETWQVIQANYTLGVIALKKKDYPLALAFMQKVFGIVAASKDSIWTGICSGSIGDIYFTTQNYTKAIPYLQTGYRLNVKHREWKNAIANLTDLIKIYLARNNETIAKQLIDAEAILIKHDNSFKSLSNYYEVLALYYEKTGNTDDALTYWKKQQEALDSIKQLTDETLYGNIQQKVETEKHISDLKNIEARTQMALLKRNLFIIILFLLMIVSLLVYNRMRVKRKAEKELFLKQEALLTSEKLRAEAERLRAEDDLQNATALLKKYTDNIRQKNKLIEQFHNEIEKFRAALPEQQESQKLDNFEKLIQSTILTDADWDDFRNLFEKVHKGFFFNLKQNFPNITVTDTRLLSLIKLQLSNREMANMLGISIYAIKKAKQRLKKKINIEKELEDMLISM